MPAIAVAALEPALSPWSSPVKSQANAAGPSVPIASFFGLLFGVLVLLLSAVSAGEPQTAADSGQRIESRPEPVSFEQRSIELIEVSTSVTEPDPEDRPSTVLAVAYTPDGKRLVSLHADRTIRVRDAQTGKLHGVATGKDAEVACLALSPDGTLLATAGSDKVVTLWEIGESSPTPATGSGRQRAFRISPQSTLAGHHSSVFSLAFSRDGRSLASGSFDQTVRFWSVSDGAAKATLTGHTQAVRAVAFSPDGRRLATGGADRVARLWDTSTGQALATLEGHTEPVCAVAFSPDGAILASGSEDRTIKLWDLKPGDAAGRSAAVPLRATLQRHTGAVWSLAFSPQGKTLASGGLDNVCRLWNPQTGALRAAPECGSAVISLAFAPDASALVMGTYDGLLSVRKAKTIDAPVAGPLKVIPGPPDTLMSVAISPDGQLLASAGKDRKVTLRRLPSCEVVRELGGHSGGICHVAFSPDGKTLGACLYNGQRLFSYGPNGVRIWNVAARQQQASLAEGTTVCAAALLPDGEQLAIGDNQGGIAIWHVASGKPVQQYTGHDDLVFQLACSPDGALLASAGKDGSLKLWPIRLSDQKANGGGRKR